MRNAFTNKPARLAAACALALGVFGTAASAQITGNEKALVLDARGAPVMSGFGLCVRSGFGPAPDWTAACDGARPVPVAQYLAPAAQPAPDPIPVASPVEMAPAAPIAVWENVAFDANVLFDSDSSELRAAGRETLDDFVGKIHGLDAESIVLVGYADRMGSHASNQTLSLERVDAVRAYLVGKGIASNRVQSSARGETRPSTGAGECKDANNPANVACMQPDRHVFIEVSGSRVAQ